MIVRFPLPLSREDSRLWPPPVLRATLCIRSAGPNYGNTEERAIALDGFITFIVQSAAGACGGRGRPEVSVTAKGRQISPGKANAAQKVLEARVGAEGIEARPEQDAGVKSLFEAFFEPSHGLICISERCVDHGNLRSIRITRV